MAARDGVLTDPKPAALVRALARAAASANGRSRTRIVAGEDWGRVAESVGRAPEGVRRFGDGGRFPRSLVGLAWWTDALGRKHVRTDGRRLASAYERDDDRFLGRLDDRPPLLLVRPDRAGLLTAGGRTRLVVACTCGACGAPEALAWTGERCGPCHDRRLERPGEPEPPAVVALGGERVAACSLSADGRLLAAVANDASVRL